MARPEPQPHPHPNGNISGCNVYWLDKGGKPAITERLNRIKPWQCFNHFPGMHNIANKARMAQVLSRMSRNFPEQYNFYPKTWVLPGEISAFSSQFDERGHSQQVGSLLFLFSPL